MTEPERIAEDGTVRKVHYGDGKQPWDYIVELGWGPAFSAGNVLKYLRRTKDREDSLKKARWYRARLMEMAADTTDTARMNDAFRMLMQLREQLTDAEQVLLSK